MSKANNNQKAIDEIKNYLYKFDYEKFYGNYRLNKKDYKASNLLFSLLISERLNVPFEYFEDITLNKYVSKLNTIALSHINNEEMKTRFIKLSKEITDITDQIVKLNGITFSFHDLLTNKIDLTDIKKDLKEKLNDNMLFSLKYVEDAEKETLDRFRKVKSPIAKLVDSKARGNAKQIGQEFLGIGFKVDNQSNILEKPILNSFLEGINDEEDFYTAAIGARNAIIQGTSSVAKSGYLNRKLSFGTVDINLSKMKDCEADKFINIKIDDKNKETILIGRYINENGNLILINKSNIDDYVGKEVKLRSPVTCKCMDGICRTCYGKLSAINKNLSIGILAATNFAEIATQMLLSTKHLLNAGVKAIPDKILEYIDISHENDTIICKKPFEMFIDESKKIFFTLYNNEVIEFQHNFKGLNISGTIPVLSLKDEYQISFNKDDLVFTGITKFVNSDMNALMKELDKCFDKTYYMAEINDYNEYYKHMIELLMKMGSLPSIHIEVILSQMVKVRNKYHLLWRQHQNEQQEIVSIRKSNLSNGLFNSLLFERVKESLVDINNHLSDKNVRTKYEELFYSQ